MTTAGAQLPDLEMARLVCGLVSNSKPGNHLEYTSPSVHLAVLFPSKQHFTIAPSNNTKQDCNYNLSTREKHQDSLMRSCRFCLSMSCRCVNSDSCWWYWIKLTACHTPATHQTQLFNHRSCLLHTHNTIHLTTDQDKSPSTHHHVNTSDIF